LLDVLDDQAMAQVKEYRIVVVGAPTPGRAQGAHAHDVCPPSPGKETPSPCWIG
jgi:hypothetical protein